MRNPLKKVMVAGASVAVALLGTTVPAGQASAAPGDPVVIDVFTFNDFHGRIDEGITVPWAYTLEKAAEDAVAAGHQVVTISAGDNIGASLFASSIAQDQPTIDVLNLLNAHPDLGFEASAVGNHEFDQGFADLTGRVIGGANGANFTYLGANVRNANDGSEALPPYIIQTLATGHRIGIIGVVTEETPSLVSPAGISTLRFEDPVDWVNTYAAQLSDGNTANDEADIIIAVYHEGPGVTSSLDNASAASDMFRRIVEETSVEVDAIVNGHTHKVYAWESTAPARPIVQTGEYGANVGHISLTWDGTAVTSFTVANIARETGTAPCAAGVVPPQFDIGNVDDIYSVVCNAIAAAAVVGQVPVGMISSDITTATVAGAYDVGGQWVTTENLATNGASERANESSLANLVADSFLWAAQNASHMPEGADIGIINAGGGIRANLLYAGDGGAVNTDGIVTYAEANAVLPFANNLFTVDITGEQFKQFLEEQWQTSADGVTRPTRQFLVTGLSENVTYTVNSDQPGDTPCVFDGPDGCTWNDANSRITGIWIDGEPIDPAKTYRIITVSFLTAGGDNYRIMAEGTRNVDTGLIDREAFVDYLKAMSQHDGLAPTAAIDPSFVHRSVVISSMNKTQTPMEPVEVAIGETLEYSVSRLNMTSQGSPAAVSGVLTYRPVGTASTEFVEALTFVSPTGDCVAEANVAAGLNPASTGCGAIKFTVPAGLTPGDYVLTVTVEENGTVANLLVRVSEAKSPTAPTAPTGGSVVGESALAVCVLLTLAGAALTGRRKLG